ncbi:MAG: NUDIX hydrolase [Acetatifactor sp.]|nr:NUDIX hydrolase [Acetatifactor sp.]
MENKIKRIDRKLEFKGAILDFYTDYMQMPDGKVVKWDFISHRKGAAAVVPVMDDGRILMVHQYRNALERMTVEIPAGARDNVQEDTKVCAARELEEETGYRSDNLEFLLSLKPTVAYDNEFIDIYVATDLKPGRQHLDQYEFIELEPMELDDLCERIYAGEIQDGKTVAALMAYKNKLLASQLRSNKEKS